MCCAGEREGTDGGAKTEGETVEAGAGGTAAKDRYCQVSLSVGFQRKTMKGQHNVWYLFVNMSTCVCLLGNAIPNISFLPEVEK